jgi:hypothetical protein
MAARTGETKKEIENQAPYERPFRCAALAIKVHIQTYIANTTIAAKMTRLAPPLLLDLEAASITLISCLAVAPRGHSPPSITVQPPHGQRTGGLEAVTPATVTVT